jgi:hypothetical protein
MFDKEMIRIVMDGTFKEREALRACKYTLCERKPTTPVPGDIDFGSALGDRLEQKSNKGGKERSGG